ncbi:MULTISPECIES: hypothetical protein [Streptomyces]|uniref:hypothetical protein n=1 Tax=Streptomyces TaxID=1883 RepID=UPI0013D99E3E|nr:MULTISPECIES: hypothetical protein [Streptomyces]QIB43026.1 hypothetical protein G3H79_08035 [Streptomyces aureoverticillatus]
MNELNVSENAFDSMFNKRISARRKTRKQTFGTVLSIDVRPPAKAKGDSQRLAQIKFPDGSKATAYIPSGVKGVTEGAPVLIRASRTNSRPEVDQRVVKPLNGPSTARQKHSKNAKYRKSYKAVANMAARTGYRGSRSAQAVTRESATRRTVK